MYVSPSLAFILPKIKITAMPYLGQITMFACNFAPSGWINCNGQFLPIQGYPALYSVIGLNFGGNGTSNFRVPSMGDVTPLGAGPGPGLSPRKIGDRGGYSIVSLNADQLAVHSHTPAATTKGTTQNPTAGVWATIGNVRPEPNLYATDMTNPQLMAAGILGSAGGVQPHNNLMPYQVVNICMSMTDDNL
jgi:microcystin-dependent protein